MVDQPVGRSLSDLTLKPGLTMILTMLTTRTTAAVRVVTVVNEDIAFSQTVGCGGSPGCPACQRLSGGWHWSWRGL
jgi:hypothetical protein